VVSASVLGTVCDSRDLGYLGTVISMGFEIVWDQQHLASISVVNL